MLEGAEKLKKVAEDRLRLSLDKERISCIRNLCKFIKGL
jgi:hypothetical protein